MDFRPLCRCRTGSLTWTICVGLCNYRIHCNSFSPTCTQLPITPTSNVCWHDFITVYEHLSLDFRYSWRRSQIMVVLGTRHNECIGVALGFFSPTRGEQQIFDLLNDFKKTKEFDSFYSYFLLNLHQWCHGSIDPTIRSISLGPRGSCIHHLIFAQKYQLLLESQLIYCEQIYSNPQQMDALKSATNAYYAKNPARTPPSNASSGNALTTHFATILRTKKCITKSNASDNKTAAMNPVFP